MDAPLKNYILTIRCPDAVGIVAAVSGFFAARKLFISESAHYGDRDTEMFFMRTVFQAPGGEAEIAAIKNAFGEIGDAFGMIWAMNDAEKKAITDAKDALKEALKGSDTEAIKAKSEALEKAVGEMSQRVYSEAAQQAQSAQGAEGAANNASGDAGKANDDGVVDADYREVDDNK